MKLSKAHIKGYQSFKDSGQITFGAGINLIVGENNAGKSALLRALQHGFAHDPHRDAERYEDFHLPGVEVDLTIEVSGAELRDAILQAGGVHGIGYPLSASPNDHDLYLENFLKSDAIYLDVQSKPGGSFVAKKFPAHGLFVHPADQGTRIVRVHGDNGTLTSEGVVGGAPETLANVIAGKWQRDAFFIAAQRFNVGESLHAHAPRLDAEARNLPAVLNTLIGNRGSVFKKLVAHVREIFSTVGNVSVRPSITHAQNVEVRIWPTEDMLRPQLSSSLASSGTGIAQVLAILTAVMTVENAVIFIDEINSFLHPAAVKSLLRILQTEYSKHQYIVSTHAPEVISFSNPKTIHLVKRLGYASSAIALNLNSVETFREIADQLGVSMADVFAAERVIWVEGQTEELCFPYLYKELIGAPTPRGTVFTSVLATGDFIAKRRDREIVYQIYDRISSATVPLGIAVVFSFDSEELTKDQRDRMRKEAKGRLHFLPRRHLECYLINSEAIAAFVVAKAPDLKEHVDARAVGLAINTEAKKLDPNFDGNTENESWLTEVDAATLIHNVCGALSNQRVVFLKKEDSLALIQHILISKPEQISPLAKYVKSLVDAAVA